MRAMTLFLATVAATMPAYAQSAPPLTPAQAVAAAMAAPTKQVEGVFEFVAVSTGAQGYNVYLNSAADYHDPGNLSAELRPAVVNALKQKLGGFPEDVLKGKRVRIKGVARRVAIQHRDGTVAYQTRIDVDTIDQIEVVG